MTQFEQTNDLVKGYTADYEEVDLPPDTVASEDIAYLDSVELHSATDHRIRKATGAATSRYLGICPDSGGIRSGECGRVIRGTRCKKTATGAILQGDPLAATDHDHVQTLTMFSDPYILGINIFGYAREDAIDGAELEVQVDPNILR